MSELLPLEKGQKGWKVRRLEIEIMEAMERATQPNTGWDVYQKIKRKVSADGEEICLRMVGLADRGYLEITGSDHDCGYLYKIPSTPNTPQQEEK